MTFVITDWKTRPDGSHEVTYEIRGRTFINVKDAAEEVERYKKERSFFAGGTTFIYLYNGKATVKHRFK